MKKIILISLIFSTFMCYTATAQLSSLASDSSSNILPVAAVSQNGGATASISVGSFEFGGNAQLAMSSDAYLVTPGDIYSLAFSTGASAVHYTIPIDTSYKVRIANLGILDARGMSFVKFRKQVEELVSKNFPMSGVQFVLTTPATFKVVIKGEVNSTTECDAWALTRLSSVLKNRTTKYASYRNVKITSLDGSVNTYDIFLATRDGDLSQNPYVKPGDVVEVSRIDRKVSITGSVERPGTYELLPGENLKNLIYRYGGGLDMYADTSRMELTRVAKEDVHLGDKIYLTKEELDNDFDLQCWDSVYITSLNEVRPAFYVEGAIRGSAAATTKNDNENTALTSAVRKTIYFHTDEDYAYLIRKNADWFTGLSDLENAYILRGEGAIPINIYTILHDPDYRVKTIIQANDILVVPFRQFFVNVSGAVANPGRYPFVPDRDYNYYVGLAGGFTDKNAYRAVRIVDMNNKKHSKKDLIEPEMTITARSNSFVYQFGRVSLPVTTILTAIYTGVLINHYAND